MILKNKIFCDKLTRAVQLAHSGTKSKFRVHKNDENNKLAIKLVLKLKFSFKLAKIVKSVIDAIFFHKMTFLYMIFIYAIALFF